MSEDLASLKKLSSLVEDNAWLATGSQDVRSTALEAVKVAFDLALQSEIHSIPYIQNLLSSLSPDEAPQTRSMARKRKRSPSPQPTLSLNPTPLSSLYTKDMDDDQIWQQLDLRANFVCEMLGRALEEVNPEDDIASEKGSGIGAENEDEFENDSDEFGMESDEEESLDGSKAEDDFSDGSEIHSGGGENYGEEVTELRDPSSSEDEGESGLDLNLDGPGSSAWVGGDESRTRGRRRKSGPSHPELDDGFFSLSEFNAEIEGAEARKTSSGRLDEEDEFDEEDEVDLFAPVQEGEVEDIGEDEEEPRYADFFVPPRKVKSQRKRESDKLSATASSVRFHDEVRVKNIKASGKNLPLDSVLNEDDEASEDEDEDEDYNESESSESPEDEEDESVELDEDEEGRYTIDRLKDDLFADDEEEDANDGLTAHGKRMAAIQQQINELEQENVQKKDWVLMGEASSRGRPQNSLLEEDLEFERAMKVVPVVTEASVADLESRIKARILEGRFDDVIRLRPMENKPFLPSRILELNDKKSSQSLAQIYENEYMASQTGDAVVDDRDGKLQREHDEIEKQWENIALRLDALCNARFTPKQPKATITTISNTPTTTLESALPTAQSVSSMLAPEEVFSPSAKHLRAKTELTPSEKKKDRQKVRKARRKQRDTLERSVDKYAKGRGVGGVKKDKAAALQSIVKKGSGVTVVGKEGRKDKGKKPKS